MTGRVLRSREVHALFVAERLAVVDVEEVARHRALHVQQAGAREVSQARKAGGMAAMRYVICAYPTKNLTNGCGFLSLGNGLVPHTAG